VSGFFDSPCSCVYYTGWCWFVSSVSTVPRVHVQQREANTVVTTAVNTPTASSTPAHSTNGQVVPRVLLITFSFGFSYRWENPAVDTEDIVELTGVVYEYSAFDFWPVYENWLQACSVWTTCIILSFICCRLSVNKVQ